MIHINMASAEPQLEEQEIRFCTTPDGVNIAYATAGDGPPLVKTANWLTHVEYDWQSPIYRHVFTELAQDHRLIRYDTRGTGLSDWDVEDFSLDAWVRDLETVVDSVDLDQFPILGISQGGPIAIEYASRHPEQVSQLVLYGSFARGWKRQDLSPPVKEEWEAISTLTRRGWGRDNPEYRQIFTSRLIPDATQEEKEWLNDLQRLSTSAENAARILHANGEIDVQERLANLEIPTLVLHCREDRMVAFHLGRDLASKIPDSRFVPLDSKNHAPLESDPAWTEFLTEVRRFLGVPSGSLSPPRVSVPGTRRVANPAEETDERNEALDLLDSLSQLQLDRYTVVGGYRRFDERTRNGLLDVYHRIQAAMEASEVTRENYLIWAPPGSGKTYFVQQVAENLPTLEYKQINFAEVGREEVTAILQSLEDAEDPLLCFVDEVDAQATEDWPYETLLPWLDINVERDNQVVFALAGSSGSSLKELQERMASRPKGTDLLSRVPPGNEVVIPPISVGDRMLIAASHLISAYQGNGQRLRGVEKLALYYVAVNPQLRNARQLREFAVQTIQRLPPGEDRVKYDHLFEPGDPANKQFWMQAMPEAEDLAGFYVSLEE